MSLDPENKELLLKAKLKLSLDSICTSALKEYCANNDKVDELKMSKNSILTLTEFLYGYSESLVDDLVAFSKHGKRQTINVDDVKLIARKSPSVVEALDKYSKQLKANKSVKKRKRTGNTVNEDL